MVQICQSAQRQMYHIGQESSGVGDWLPGKRSEEEKMSNKTCGECKHLNRELAFCRKCGARWMREEQPSCDDFEAIQPPTNGDVIRQGGDTAAKKMIGNAVCPPLTEAFLWMCHRCRWWASWLKPATPMNHISMFRATAGATTRTWWQSGGISKILPRILQ